MKTKQQIAVILCVNLALIFFHLYHKSRLISLNSALQTVIAEKNHIIAQTNERQLMLERLRNPTHLAQEAKNRSMEKIRLSKIKPLPRMINDALPTL